MTDKLKCPFCQQELIREGMNHWWCSCNIEHQGKELYGTTALWQALISSKKAQDALKGIEIRVAAIRSCVQDGYTQLGERNRNIFIALELFKDLTKEITSITKREE